MPQRRRGRRAPNARMGRRRMAGQRCAAGREPRAWLAKWAGNPHMCGHRGAVQQCGPHRRNDTDRSDARAVTWRSARSTRHSATPRAAANNKRDICGAMTDRRATQRLRRRATTSICELGTRREHVCASQRGATERDKSSQTTKPERGVRTSRDVAWPPRDLNLTRGTTRGAVDDNERHIVKRCDAGLPGNEALPTEKRETECEVGARRAHIWSSLRGATVQAASSQPEQDAHNMRDMAWHAARSLHRALRHPATPRATAKKTWGEYGRPSNARTPAANRNNILRSGRATRAYVDIAADRNSASRLATHRSTGARRARHARCGMTGGEITTLCAATPRPT